MAIPSCLIDTNILLRMTRRSDPQHQLVDTALAHLASQGTIFHYTHQNIAELWNAMTRPLARNGLGLTVNEAEREVRAIEAGMVLLPDSEAVYREWRRIVLHQGVLGVQVHDARSHCTAPKQGLATRLSYSPAGATQLAQRAAKRTLGSVPNISPSPAKRDGTDLLPPFASLG